MQYNCRHNWINFEKIKYDKEKFEGFEIELKDLKPEVKEKALELAENYHSQGLEPKAVLKKAVATAEAWFMDLEG